MILRSVVVQNVGVFRGRHTLELAAPSKARPVTTVLALNGSGKTTFLESLRIGLYGRRSPSFTGGRGYERYLKGFIHRGMPVAEEALVEVELQVRTDGVLHTLLVTRTWTTDGAGGVAETLAVRRDGVLNAAMSDNWAETIEEWLPAQLSQFCFFDGEQLAALADPGRSQEVLRGAVRTLLGLDLVDQLDADLKVLDRRRKERSLGEKEASSLSPLLEAAESADAAVQQLLLERGGLANRVERARLVLQEAAEALEAAGGAPDAQRERLLAQRDAAAAQAHALENDLRELAYGAAPLLLVQDALRRIRQQDPLVGIPGALEQLASRDTWLIDQLGSLTDSAPLISRVSQLMEQDRRLRVERQSGAAASTQVTETLLELPTLEQRLRTGVTAAKSAYERVDQIDRELERLPTADDVSAPHHVWQSCTTEHSEAHAALEACEQRLTHARRAREAAVARYQTSLEASVRDAQVRRESELLSVRSEELRSTLAVFRGAMLQRHAQRLGELVSECFARLHRKSGMVDTIAVDSETLAMSLVHPDGSLIPAERLSAGERQLLAIATIWGILRASGRLLPLVIDTPLGRLDSVHRSRLVKQFFALASHQVVLLVTDTEMDEGVRSNLADVTGATYQIEHMTGERRSELHRVERLALELTA